MPEHLRALVIILATAIVYFAYMHQTAISIADATAYIRRRNSWIILTLAAFLSGSFWIYLALAIPVLLFSARSEPNQPALFLFVLLALPAGNISIPGLGLVNYIFDLSHIRVLELCILLPAAFYLKRQSDTIPFGRNLPDKALAVYMLLSALLPLRETTLTDTMRHAFYLYIDVYLPYYVLSRALSSQEKIREAILSMVIAIMLVGLLAVFETFRHWLLYDSLIESLGLDGMRGYLGRDGTLRAVVTTGQAIPLGYVMAVGLGLYLYLMHFFQVRMVKWAGLLFLLAGLVAPYSRGPWIGAAAMLVIFIANGRHAVRNLIVLGVGAVLALGLISIIPGGEKVINLLPYIGNTEKGNIDYRERLFANSMIVIQRNPWLGSTDYLKTPEMQAMKQGQGIIDIVNSYLQITLEAGFTGLALFVSIFALIILGVFRAMRAIRDKNSEEYRLGRSLLATLSGILIIITTVSSITVIPIVYWTMAGMSVAYIQVMKNSIRRGHPTEFR